MLGATLRAMPIEVQHTATEDSPPVGIRILIVSSAYNRWITEPLESGAVDAAERLCDSPAIEIVQSSGALEIPHLVATALDTKRFDAAVALGCIIKGETVHDRLIGAAVIERLVQTAVQSGVPVGVGVLTVENPEQAEARAGGAHGNKGAEAMEAAIASMLAIRSLKNHTPPGA